MPVILPDPLLYGLAALGVGAAAWAFKVLFVSIYSAPYDPTEERE